MSQTASVLHHAQKNHALTFRTVIEKLAYVAGLLNPIGTLPQLFQIFSSRDASGVSLFTWTSFLLISIVMTLYGVIHKEKPLIMMYGALIAINFMIVVGILIY